jgi:hypothetical protein
MAIKLKVQYPGRVKQDANDPEGNFLNSSAPGALDGMPSDQEWARDMWSLLARLLAEASIVASGVADSQLNSQIFNALQFVSRNIFPAYDSAFSYSRGQIVLASDEQQYQSLINVNLNKDPVSSPAEWVVFGAALATTTAKGIKFLLNPIDTANSGVDFNNDIVFSAGNFNFDDGSGSALVNTLIKKLDVNWIAGNDQGGLDIGVKAANTTYHCFAIRNLTSEISDFIYSLSPTSPTLPAGYTKKELVWSILTDGSSNIRGYKQEGKYCYWDLPVADFNLSNPGIGPDFRSLTVPTGVPILTNTKFVGQKGTGADTYGMIYSPLIPDPVLPSINFNNLYMNTVDSSVSSYDAPVLTNNLGEVKSHFSFSGPALILRVFTFGWIHISLKR